MYFNDKNDTNIDNEFKSKKNTKSTKSSKKKKKIEKIPKSILPYILFGVLFIFGLIMIAIANRLDGGIITTNSKTYYLDLLGSDNITYYLGEEYIEPGYIGYDAKRNNLTNKVDITSNVDMSKTGDYTITYTLNNVTRERKISVIEKPIGATYIHLQGDVNVYINAGEEYIEPGYIVVDTVDGDKLKDSVAITNNVDTSKAGVYKVIYSVVNSSGITTTNTRNVIVMSGNLSLTLDNYEYTNGNVKINVYISDPYHDYLILPNGDKVTANNYMYEVSENGNYKFIIYNKKGSNKEGTINVSNIDRTNPTGSCSGSYQNGVSTINVKASDNIGISKYVINNTSYTSDTIKINSEMPKANITIYDKAGNNISISCNLTNKNKSNNSGNNSNTGNSSNTGSSSNSDSSSNTGTSNSSTSTVKSDKIEIHFIASGHYDDAILIRTDDKVILIDSGRYRCRQNVTPYLKELGVKKIDAMIGSHLQNDHIAAQADILANFTVGNIYYPDDIFTCASRNSCVSDDQEYIVDALKKYGKTPTVITSPEKITIGEMELYFLAPHGILTGSNVQNTNSFIFILKFYNNSFMFTGDAGNKTMDVTKLSNNAKTLGVSLDVDILKYPHHGNGTLSSGFLNIIKPEYVIVPNYYAPKYPTESNQQVLTSRGIKIYRQSDSSTGNIVITSDGKNINIKTGITASQYKR